MDGDNNSLLTDDEATNIIGGFIIAILLAGVARNLPTILRENFGEEWTYVINYLRSFQETGLYTTLFAVAFVFSVLCLGGAVYAGIRLAQVKKAEQRRLQALTHAAISGEDTENERWQEILAHAASDDEELWRLAIIEADAMMDEMLDKAGYPQDSLGDKLRSAERSDFRTIDSAWEAHKLRNVLAHKGSTYDLTEREVQEAIENYRRVFQEFGYV